MLACAPVPPLAGLTCDRPTAYSAWVGQSAGLAERCWYIQLASRMPGRLITAETPPRKGCCPIAGRRGRGNPRHPADRLIRDRSRHTRLGPVGRAGVRVAAGLALDGGPSARPVQTAVRWESRPATWIWTVMRGGTGGGRSSWSCSITCPWNVIVSSNLLPNLLTINKISSGSSPASITYVLGMPSEFPNCTNLMVVGYPAKKKKNSGEWCELPWVNTYPYI